MTNESPHTVAVLAEIPRGPRTRLTVSIDEDADGSRWVAIKRWLLGKQGEWVSPRGVSVQRTELRAVGWALLRAADDLDRGGAA